EAVRRVQPGRCHDRSALRRHGARPCPLAQARAHDGRRRDRDERARQGLGVHGASAGRFGTLTKRLRNAPNADASEQDYLICHAAFAAFSQHSFDRRAFTHRLKRTRCERTDLPLVLVPDQSLQRCCRLSGSNIAMVTSPTSGRAAGMWVPEGAAIPVRAPSFSAVTLARRKLAVIAVFTRETAEGSNIEAIVRQTLSEASGLALDAA